MEDNYYLQNCGDDDVVSFGDTTYKVSKVKKALNESFGADMGSSLHSQLRSKGVYIDPTIVSPSGIHQAYDKWFNKGINCEILNLGSKKWKKGKVKIKVSFEFYVEEEESKETENDETTRKQPESPLDDLRKAIAEGKLAE